MNMRRLLKKPTLRMEDGGQMGILQRATDTYKSMQPVDPAAAPEQTRITPLQLRDGGGPVPGQGTGDKIPALYEPGEFVVSNDMLKAEPGLREQLHDLRGNVLAAQGKTPEEADAKSLRGGTLRAATGADPWEPKNPMFDTYGTNSRRGMHASGVIESAADAQAKLTADKAAARPSAAPIVDEAAATREALNKATARATGAAPEAPVPGAAAPTAVRPNLRSMANSGARTFGPGFLAGAAGDTAARLTAGIGDTSGEPVRSQAPSPADAIPGGAGRFSAPAAQPYNFYSDNETGRNIGNLLSAGATLPGGGAVRGLALAATGGAAGRVRSMREEGPESTPSTPGTPGTNPANQTAATRARTGLRLDDRTGLPSKLDSRSTEFNNTGPSRDFTNELNARPKGNLPELPNDLRNGVVHKTVDAQGRVTYSGRNVGVNKDGETQMVDGTGRTLKMMNGNNSNFVRDVATGKTAYGAGNSVVGPSGDVSQGLRTGSGDVGRAFDAALARGDSAAVKAYYANKGETFAGVTPEQYKAQQEEADAPKRGEFGFKQYQANKIAQEQNKTQLRGQDITSADGRYGHELTAQTGRARLRQEQFISDRSYNREVGNGNFTQGAAAQKNITERFASMLPPGEDGKPDTNTSSRYMAGLNTAVTQRQGLLKQHLKLNPNDATAQRELADIGTRGVAALGDDAIHKHFAGMQLADLASATSTSALTPWGTKAVVSTAPITRLTKLSNGDYQTDRGTKDSPEIIPGRYVDKVGGVLGVGGKRNMNFESLKE